MRKFEKKNRFRKKKFRHRYQNWALVLVPDTETWFRSHTTVRWVRHIAFKGSEIALFKSAILRVLIMNLNLETLLQSQIEPVSL